jgi:hypothetical protein
VTNFAGECRQGSRFDVPERWGNGLVYGGGGSRKKYPGYSGYAGKLQVGEFEIGRTYELSGYATGPLMSQMLGVAMLTVALLLLYTRRFPAAINKE